jgi:hypothetical protein
MTLCQLLISTRKNRTIPVTIPLCVLSSVLYFICMRACNHGTNEVRQIELHTAKPLVPEPNYL